MTSTTRTLSTTLLGLGAGVALAVTAPLAASAHVSITPNQADPGASQNFVIQALNESATASTVKLEVALPTDTPISSVRYQATPGWSTEVITGTLPEPVEVSGNTLTEAPMSIVFTADAGGGIRPGAFQSWTVSLGPIPETGSLLLPSIQTYDDGEIANWTASAEELDADDTLKPAPVLFIEDEVKDGHHGGSADEEAASGDSHGATTETTSAQTADSSDTALPLGLSIAALVLAAVGAVLGALALFGRKRAA
ncbi:MULTISPECIES: YcnI family protein [unclassified Rathayibacter]|uniref:YcnI family copper-binding membrane protein n=1 Tax=unclassified Rathayibacter TaxID=2609250 RepID=UPI001889DAE4|nr:MULTISPECIES: YcnI family protein [unclassified Rathayibacter]MBF4461951.1 YcnI family protein [Rathayibacter sp. VKM Ac-2879]MBF4504006.1 YcnI family protein [Rathayibacter sp. VKM Ac-2878]